MKIFEKIKLIKKNPKIIKFWIYKILNYIKHNPLNNGERYDPNILKKFGINDPHQINRYEFAKNFIKDGDTLLDIACGTGYGIKMLSEKTSSATGVDISPQAINYARNHYQREKINFLIADIFKYEQPADVVLSFETIEHIGADIEQTILKLISLSKRILICSVPYNEKKDNNRHHIHFEIQENNFDFLKEKYKYNFLYQTEDGLIYKERKTEALSLIIVIDKSIF